MHAFPLPVVAVRLINRGQAPDPHPLGPVGIEVFQQIIGVNGDEWVLEVPAVALPVIGLRAGDIPVFNV